MRGGEVCAYTTYFCPKLSGFFTVLQQMHDGYFICSADQEKLAVRTRFALSRCCPLQLLPPAGGTRRRVGVVAHEKKNRTSMVRVNIAVTVRSTTASRLLRLLLPLSR